MKVETTTQKIEDGSTIELPEGAEVAVSSVPQGAYHSTWLTAVGSSDAPTETYAVHVRNLRGDTEFEAAKESHFRWVIHLGGKRVLYIELTPK